MNARAIAALILLAALATWAAIALGRRAEAGADYRRVAAAAALPRIVTASHRLVAPNLNRARGDLARRIGDAGAGAGVRLSLTPSPAGEAIEGVVGLRVVARGDESRLLRFSAQVEQGRALVRWTRWSIAPDGDGSLRLSADAAAPWGTR